MRRAPLVVSLAGGGTAWAIHLLAGYFVVALGCPRGWPGLGWLLAAITAVCAAAAVVVAVVALRERVRARRRSRNADSAGVLFGVGGTLASLFAIMIVLGGLTAAVLPPCQAAIGG